MYENRLKATVFIGGGGWGIIPLVLLGVKADIGFRRQESRPIGILLTSKVPKPTSCCPFCIHMLSLGRDSWSSGRIGQEGLDAPSVNA